MKKNAKKGIAPVIGGAAWMMLAQKYFNAIGVILVAIDTRQEVILINKKGHRILGCRAKDIVGKNWFDNFLPPACRETARAAFLKLISGKQAPGRYLDYPVICGNRQARWISWYSNVLKDSRGRIAAVLCSGQDISERKKAEEALMRMRQDLQTEVAQRTAQLKDANWNLRQEAAERKEIQRRLQAQNSILKLLAKSSSRKDYLDAVVKLVRGWSGLRCAGIRVAGEGGRIPYESFKGFSWEFWQSENMLSLGRDQCLCVRIFTGKLSAADKQIMTAYGSFRCNSLPEFAAGLSERQRQGLRGACIKAGFKSVAIIPIRYKNEVLGAVHLADERQGRADLKMIEFLESLMPFLGEGIYSFSLYDNVVKSRELLERVFSSSNFLIAYLDADFNFIRVNDAYAANEGKTPDFFTGKSHFALYPHEENKEIFKRVLETGQPYSTFAKPFIYEEHPERGVTYWDWSLQPVREASGQVEGLILFLVDVTQRKKTEEELIRAQGKLAESKRLSDIGALAATVAHELRNPLAAIYLASSNIKRKAPGPLLEKHLATIEKKVNESEQIISNLLFYSRLKYPQYEKINIHEIIRESAELIKQRYPNQRIRMYKKSALKGAFIEADSVQIKEVISNILNNASEAASESGGAIEIEAMREDLFLAVRVKDNGPGIEGEDLKRVFDPFFTTKARGTGLGLTVCKQILSLHGGTIDIASLKGQGTTVTLKIPFEKSNPASHNANRPAVEISQ